MNRYAEQTSVSADRSRAEIERILQRYGASSFAYGWQGNEATIMFDKDGRRIRFNLPLPDKTSREFLLTPAKRQRRTPEQAHAAWEQATRQRWRALALLIKAKLEAIESNISSFESEFLNKTVLPGGMTVDTWLLPQIDQAYTTQQLPPLLPGTPGAPEA
jgi:hypothetical protein